MDINCLNKEGAKPITVVCRLCINFTVNSYPISYLKLCLDEVLPDIDLTLTSNPVICINCLNSVTASFNFKKNCKEKERQIRHYYELTKNTVNLPKMVESQQACDTNSSVPKHDLINHYANNINIIKTEELQLSLIKEQQNSFVPTNIIKDVFVKNTSKNLPTTEKKDHKHSIILKDEQVIIKQEQNDLENSFFKSKQRSFDSELGQVLGQFSGIKNLKARVESENDMPNVIEIVKADIGSDLGSDVDLNWSDDKDFKSFKEFCWEDSLSNSGNVLEHSRNGSTTDESLENMEKTKDPTDGGSESEDSSDIFTEDCNLDLDRSDLIDKCKMIKNIDLFIQEKKICLPLQLDSISPILCKNDPKEAKKTNPSYPYKKINKKNFSCSLCHKTFAQKLHVDGHLLSKHKNIPDIEKKVKSKIHYCQYCLYRTINNFSLSSHLVSKHNKKNSLYECKFRTLFCAHCQYSTKNKGNLILHTRRHNLVKAFFCLLCDKTFNQKGNLDKHYLISHTAGKESIKLANN